MRGPLRRRALLGLIFSAMHRSVRRKAMERENATVEWRITGRPDNRPDVRQLVVGDGRALMLDGEPGEADLTITMDGVDFLLLATGGANGPAMFVNGDLQIDGDPWLAARLPKFFALPAAAKG